jgi:hypothetical protein
MANFQYEPLRAPVHQPDAEMIRLIEIEDSDWGDEVLNCHIRHFALRDAPSYTTLSYCWGDPNITHPIWCNGAVLDITTNLYSALINIRDTLTAPCINSEGEEQYDSQYSQCLLHEHRAKWLWADAMCINQTDLLEKNQQVPLMRQIYSNSKKTLIWLGPDVNDYAITMIDKLARAYREYQSRNDTRFLCQMDYQTLQLYDIPHVFHGGYKELLTLFDNPWFQRVWIIQEVAVSKSPFVKTKGNKTEWENVVMAMGFATCIGALPSWNNVDTSQKIASIEITRR